MDQIARRQAGLYRQALAKFSAALKDSVDELYAQENWP